MLPLTQPPPEGNRWKGSNVHVFARRSGCPVEFQGEPAGESNDLAGASAYRTFELQHLQHFLETKATQIRESRVSSVYLPIGELAKRHGRSGAHGVQLATLRSGFFCNQHSSRYLKTGVPN